MPPEVFEFPIVSTSERPQTHALDSAATGIGIFYNIGNYNYY